MPHVRTTTLLTTVGLAVGLALTVSGCTGGDRDAVTPTPSTSTTARATGTPTPTGSATPGPTPGAGASSTTTTPATAAGKVPATCDDVVTPGAFDFTDVMPLNDPAVVGGMEIPRTALTPAGRSDGQRLYCVWRDPRADVSNLTVLVEDVVPSRATEALRGLSGFDCSTVDDGFRCQQVRQNQQYPVIDGDTYFTRGGIGIHIHQSNVPTDGLLDDVVGNVFR
ncbi:hypothetical protein ACIPEQ_14800 [Curtobacterium sp. NPDC087080]|uniref:hypothetical protein n=1 Tax=Curtobacterium sp. NPDC087080 TaxID=3363965 RepID=UPI003802C520